MQGEEQGYTRELKRFLDAQNKGNLVCDLGCGKGAAALKIINREMRVIGGDPSEAELKVFDKRLGATRVTRHRYPEKFCPCLAGVSRGQNLSGQLYQSESVKERMSIKADTSNLSQFVGTAACDAVDCAFVFIHICTAEGTDALRGIHQILKPGGQFYLATNVTEKGEGLCYSRKHNNDASKQPTMFHCWNKDELKDKVAGLFHIRTGCLTGGGYLPDKRAFQHLCLHAVRNKM